VNSTGNPLNVALTMTAGQGISVTPVDPFTLAPGERARQIAEVHIGSFAGESDFLIHADAGAYADEVDRKLSVRPLGFPIEWARGGMIDTGGNVSYD
jgi:hypothetical protein